MLGSSSASAGSCCNCFFPPPADNSLHPPKNASHYEYSLLPSFIPVLLMASAYVDSCHDPLQLCIQGFYAGQWMGRQLSWVETRERERGKEKGGALWYQTDTPFAYFCQWNARAANLRLFRTIAFHLLSERKAEEEAFNRFLFFFNAAGSLESLWHLNLNEIANCLALHPHIWIGFAWFLHVTQGI